MGACRHEVGVPGEIVAWLELAARSYSHGEKVFAREHGVMRAEQIRRGDYKSISDAE